MAKILRLGKKRNNFFVLLSTFRIIGFAEDTGTRKSKTKNMHFSFVLPSFFRIFAAKVRRIRSETNY